MKIFLITLLFTLASPCWAFEVKTGVSLDEASKAMKAAKYRETRLEMATLKKDRLGLKFWSVDDGVLIVVYSLDTKKTTGVSFWLADERAKAHRKTFEFNVKSFDTATGDLLLETRKRNSPK